jgi:hypothetical protein
LTDIGREEICAHELSVNFLDVHEQFFVREFVREREWINAGVGKYKPTSDRHYAGYFNDGGRGCYEQHPAKEASTTYFHLVHLPRLR